MSSMKVMSRPPRVRPVDNQPLKQHARDLLLDHLLRVKERRVSMRTALGMCVGAGRHMAVGNVQLAKRPPNTNLAGGLGEEVEEHAGEVVRVVVGVAQLVGNRVEEQVAASVSRSRASAWKTSIAGPCITGDAPERPARSPIACRMPTRRPI